MILQLPIHPIASFWKLSLASFLAFLLLAISGCGRDPETANKVNSPDNTITVGSILVLSGQNAHYGEDTKAGMDIGLDYANTKGITYTDPAGKQHTYKLAIDYKNSHGGPNNTVNAPEQMQKLISEGRPAVLGAFFSGITLSLAPIADESKIVLLTPCSTNYKLREQGKWVFRILPTDYDQAIQMAVYGHTVLNDNKAAVIYIDNSYGQDLATAFVKKFESLGGEVVFNRNFAEGTKEFGGFVNALLTSGAQFLFLVGHTQEMTDILRTKHQAEIKAGKSHLPVLGTDGMYDSTFVTNTGEAAEGIVLASAGFNPNSSNSTVKEFVTDFKTRFNHEPNLWSAGGYDSVLVIAEAIRNGGATPQGIREALSKIKGLAGATGVNTVDESGGMADKPVHNFIIRNGKFQELSKSTQQ